MVITDNASCSRSQLVEQLLAAQNQQQIIWSIAQPLQLAHVSHHVVPGMTLRIQDQQFSPYFVQAHHLAGLRQKRKPALLLQPSFQHLLHLLQFISEGGGGLLGVVDEGDECEFGQYLLGPEPGLLREVDPLEVLPVLVLERAQEVILHEVRINQRQILQSMGWLLLSLFNSSFECNPGFDFNPIFESSPIFGYMSHLNPTFDDLPDLVQNQQQAIEAIPTKADLSYSDLQMIETVQFQLSPLNPQIIKQSTKQIVSLQDKLKLQLNKRIKLRSPADVYFNLGQIILNRLKQYDQNGKPNPAVVQLNKKCDSDRRLQWGVLKRQHIFNNRHLKLLLNHSNNQIKSMNLRITRKILSTSLRATIQNKQHIDDSSKLKFLNTLKCIALRCCNSRLATTFDQ